MKKNVYAVLLAGGKGTRLWPLSTESHSKSFISVGKKKPLIAETIERLRGLIYGENIVIVVDKSQRKLLKGFIRKIPKRNILVEPFGRSTASAAGLAAIELDPEDIMVVLPTDAFIKEPDAFKKTIRKAIDFVSKEDEALMCVGIRPKEASSAYGYVKVKSRKKGEIYLVDRFIEKPKKKVAAALVKKTNYLWNAGMFVFKAKSILAAIKKHAPTLHRELSRIKKDKRKKVSAYSRMKNVSIDYQIMEKVKTLYCVRGNFSWVDLGSWTSLEGLFKKDKNGNISFGKVSLRDTHNSIVYNSEKEKLGVVGLKDAVVAHTKNGTLVCNKKDAEEVKKLVSRLKK